MNDRQIDRWWDRLVVYATERGNCPRDVRDAVHEAVHALSVVAGDDWDREHIHAEMMERMSLSAMIDNEVEARAVETIVCHMAGIEYDVRKWAITSMKEATATELVYIPHDMWVTAITDRVESAETAVTVEAVCALVDV